MIDAFEDHCWKDVVPADVLELYKHYHRDTYVGESPALVAIDLYEAAYQGGNKPVSEVSKTLHRHSWICPKERRHSNFSSHARWRAGNRWNCRPSTRWPRSGSAA